MSTPSARDLMTDRVLDARADGSLQEIVSFFTQHVISGASLVSEYGEAIGVVSLTDITRHGPPLPRRRTSSRPLLISWATPRSAKTTRC